MKKIKYISPLILTSTLLLSGLSPSNNANATIISDNVAYEGEVEFNDNPDIVDLTGPEEDVVFIEEEAIEPTPPGDGFIEPTPINRVIEMNTIKTFKKNVKKYTKWSKYRHVSKTFGPNPRDSKVHTEKSTVFKAETSGIIKGLGLSLGGEVTTKVGLTTTLPAKKVGYLGIKVKYKVETGTRIVKDMLTNKIISQSKYTIKTPIKNTETLQLVIKK